MADDSQLLRRYVEERSEEAFAELVRRHLGWVYQAGLRRTGGRSDLAQDVAQDVFTALARNATALSHRAILAGSLHTTTRFAASRTLRAEDANRFNPIGAHSHSTPLHQAAYHGHEATVRLLLQYGASTDVRDILYQATPLEWARHAGQKAIVELIQAHVAQT